MLGNGLVNVGKETLRRTLRGGVRRLKAFIAEEAPSAPSPSTLRVAPIRPDPLTSAVWQGSGGENMILIAGIARATKAKRYLEIGAYRGFTSGFVRWANPDIEIHAIDNWQRVATSPNELREGIARIAGDSSNVHVHEGDSKEELKKLIDQRMTFDLIYVDGCHTYDYAKSDFEAALKLLGPTGTVVIDDTVTWWGPRELSEELQAKGVPAGFHLLEIQTSNGLLILRKQPKVKGELALTRENCPNGVWDDARPPVLKSA